jgi:outer membrane protein TolC
MIIMLVLLQVFSGCRTQPKKANYIGDADLQYYKNVASEISNPAIITEVSNEVEESIPPRTIESREHDEVWDLSLQECIQIGLSKSEIIKSVNQFLSPSNSIYTSGEQVNSVFDPAIQDSGPLFGSLGTEAALSRFDVNWSTSMFYGNNRTVQNSLFNGVPLGVLNNDTATFSSGLTKQFATGGTFTVAHQWNYLSTNSNQAVFGSSYSGNVNAQIRQPLLAGGGVEYVRVAGPSQPGLSSITGVNQGVVIARINNDISITNFEANVRNLTKDIEDTYWDLYLTYRNYDTARKAQAYALQTWRILNQKKNVGGFRGFSTWQEPQARDRYFETESQAKNTLSLLYINEQKLRNLIHLPVNDGKIIRPTDEPVSARVTPDWYLCLTEALTERVELRRQKWTIKSLMLQLEAARSLVRPRLDLVGNYQVNGFGDHLLRYNDNDVVGSAQGYNSAYETLTQGNQPGWNAGFEFSMPIGFRQAKTQVKNLELRLTKAQRVLQNQESEIAQELAVAFQEVTRTYNIAVSNFNRREAAIERMKLLTDVRNADVEISGDPIDLLLRAQESLASAESIYFTSLVEYNKTLVNLEFRKGTLLAHNNIQLLEGTWSAKAYQEALDRAWARSHAIPYRFDRESTPADFASPIPPQTTFAFRRREDQVPDPIPEGNMPIGHGNNLMNDPAIEDNPVPQATPQMAPEDNKSNVPGI